MELATQCWITQHSQKYARPLLGHLLPPHVAAAELQLNRIPIVLKRKAWVSDLHMAKSVRKTNHIRCTPRHSKVPRTQKTQPEQKASACPRECPGHLGPSPLMTHPTPQALLCPNMLYTLPRIQQPWQPRPHGCCRGISCWPGCASRLAMRACSR